MQTVQYILPQHHERLAQAELLVIDEAAAIPLPVVKAMLGPYLVFLCSTVNGWGPSASPGSHPLVAHDAASQLPLVPKAQLCYDASCAPVRAWLMAILIWTTHIMLRTSMPVNRCMKNLENGWQAQV